MRTLFKNFYKGKTVLVTGHTGFKGSWLSIWLRKLGANVIGYALDPYTKYDNFLLSNLKDKIVDIRGDIRDKNKLKEVFKKYKPDIVFHLAAQSLVRLSYKIPKETYEVNVMGTLNVLDCIRECDSVKVGVMITTDKCYENKEQIWGYKETDAMGGYDPYSSSKGCAELLIASYRNSFMNPNEYEKHGKAISSVRAGNVIGGGDWQKDRIVPDCIRALIDNKPIKIRNPNAVRPFQHVLEPLSGYLLLASKMYKDGLNYCDGWNFGPDYDSIVNVETIVNLIIKEWASGKWINLSGKEAPYEANLLSLDCTKAKTYLGWKPRLTIEEAIGYTVDWYKNFQNSNVYELCLNQIKEYLN
ncbi:CDP-glucose 4,6-dehydratase [Oceanirhabdus sp. W0125-5]|uniref:CDP-glucose 4,6-dehydratase n=1 Tax=Oceanirhabdus sp. W0125-5 TaxID=2999116 RepID=UPI0022F3022A|nr:CDP-glucose 4,6-dehydratase [Oceanirhabdus sp. W0125-5]WBW96650.1 CDP-glucose 4,6-dehydratase [Oceanirhabdus sp. W0125-5]